MGLLQGSPPHSGRRGGPAAEREQVLARQEIGASSETVRSTDETPLRDRFKTMSLLPTSSSAASSSTCCPAASTASDPMACSPAARASTTSRAPVHCTPY